MRYYYLIMKLLFSIFAYCIIATCAFSQKLTDTVYVRVQYHASYKYTQEQKDAFDDTNLLDIGKHSSRFYSQRFESFLRQRDSVRSATSDPMSYLQFLGDWFGSKKGREYEVYKHIPQKGMLTYTDCLHNDFFFCYEEPIPTFSWKLMEGDTLIIGYTCKPSASLGDALGQHGILWICPLTTGRGKWEDCQASYWQLLKAKMSFRLLPQVSNSYRAQPPLAFSPIVTSV